MEPRPTHDDNADVSGRTRRGLSWNVVGALATNAMRVVVIAVLGRALSSRDFGIVAAAISVNVILYSVRDIGVGQALIQRAKVERGHETTAFAVSLYLGLAIAALLIAAAPWIGDLYGIPASVDVLRALALLFALRGASATARMMCQRRMQFRAIAIIDAFAFCTGSIVSMVSAIRGAGPWALVAGYLVEEALSTGLYMWTARPAMSLRIERARLRELMSFGAGQTLAQVAGILATYGDTFVIGRGLGAGALGFYTRAYDLIKLPSMVFANVVGSVLFPAFSRLQHDRAALGAGFRRALFFNALILLPASAALVVLAPEVIEVLMGRGWDHAVTPFRVLAVTMLFRTTQKLGGLVATAAGSVNAVALAYVVYMVLVIGGASIGVRWGVDGVAVTTSIAILVVSLECSYLSIRVSDQTWRSWLAAHGPGTLLAALTGAITWGVAELLRGADLAAPVVVLGSLAPAILACLACCVLWIRRGRGDFEWLSQEVARVTRRLSRRRPR